MRACRRTSRSPRPSCSRSSCTGRSPASSRRRRRSAGTSSPPSWMPATGGARGPGAVSRSPSASRSGVREMFALQPRLEHPRGRRALRSLEHPRFRAAYDLLLLRAQLGLASQRDRRLVDPPAGSSRPRSATRWPTRWPVTPRARRARRAHPGAPAAGGVAVPVRVRPEGAWSAGSPPISAWAATCRTRRTRCWWPPQRLAQLPRTCCVRMLPAVCFASPGADRPAGLRATRWRDCSPSCPPANCWRQLRAIEAAFGRPAAARALGAAHPGPRSAFLRARALGGCDADPAASRDSGAQLRSVSSG